MWTTLIPWWGRWLAIGGLFASVAGWAAIKMHEHDQRIFDEYEDKVKAAGDRQNELTHQIILVHKQAKENADAQAKQFALARDAALARLRVAQARSGSGVLPTPPAGTVSSNRVCFAADQLDRGIRESLGRVQARALALAAEGQRGVDTAIVCRSWAVSVAKK